jgi:hypothetical protein
VLVSMVTICIPSIMSSKGNNLIIRHPFICCLAHARCLAYCWTQVVHLRFAPMYLCGLFASLLENSNENYHRPLWQSLESKL